MADCDSPTAAAHRSDSGAGDFDCELRMRVARARQTMDFAAAQRARFSQLSVGRLTIWQALALLDELPPCAPPTGTGQCMACGDHWCSSTCL